MAVKILRFLTHFNLSTTVVDLLRSHIMVNSSQNLAVSRVVCKRSPSMKFCSALISRVCVAVSVHVLPRITAPLDFVRPSRAAPLVKWLSMICAPFPAPFDRSIDRSPVQENIQK